MSYEQVMECADYIKSRYSGPPPKIALVLGSGLNHMAEALEDATTIPYAELPHFPKPTVEGHSGYLHLGIFAGQPVAFLQGRVHGYEGQSEQNLAFPTRTMWALGAEIMFLTNAAGSLIPEAGPGNLMLITDHINLSGMNPTVGPNDERFGPRFYDMTYGWDHVLSDKVRASAQALDIKLYEGVYVGVKGPNFETPAEIRFFQQIGGGSVGMSTVSEALTANHCGMKVVGISTMTNYGAGISPDKLNHEEVMEYGQIAAVNLGKLIHHFLENL